MTKSYDGSLELTAGNIGLNDLVISRRQTASLKHISVACCFPMMARHYSVKEAVAPQKTDAKSFDELIQAVRGRLDLIPAVFPARAEFYTRKQLPSESVATLMSNLRHLAGRCHFEAAPTVGERIDFQLQDQFLIGMSAVETRCRVLRGPKITLEELYNAALTGGSAVEQSKLINSHSASLPQPTIHGIDNKRRSKPAKHVSSPSEDIKCWRCGCRGHNADYCRS
ncbi:hypothetical protein M513_04234 [Trichuris suis]|uniref:CCHC-type domain-containing protein n=1 Tax=Trichuris suis TaxID=68888 RepID=A0A085MC54_9BILA|nr:hypothetical protein M513_04234 [Trichuris suis]